MMRGLGSLIKMHLNVNFGISAIKFKYFKQKKELWQPIIFILVFISLLPIYIGYIHLLKSVHSTLLSINQEGALLLFGILGSQVILFIFGISHIFAKFYYADDLQILIPLPIKPSTILTARFITVMINEYITILPVVLPIMAVYGVQGGLGALYWLYCLLIFIVIPVIPLVLSAMVTMFFMKYTNIKGKRDLIRVIGGIIITLVAIGMQVVIRNAATTLPPGGEMQYIANLISNKNSLIAQLGTSFPPSIWAATGLSSYQSTEGLLYILLFVVTSALIFLGMIIMSEKVFYAGLIGGQEITAKKKSLTDVQLKDRTSKLRHPILSIMERDMKILIRTPIFLMNSIGAVIIIPFAIAIPVFMGDPAMVTMLTQFYKDENMLLINLVLSAFIIFLGANNGIGATTFSREGKEFWISRIVPIKVEYHLMGKILSSVLVQILAIVVSLGGALFVVPIKLSTIIIVSVLGLLGSVPMIELSMFIDIFRPLLDWDNPQKAMKQNMNVLLSMLIGMGYILVLFLASSLMMKLKVNPYIIYSVFGVGFIVLSVVLFKALSSFTNKRFREIE